jgi:hypothetical protein
LGRRRRPSLVPIVRAGPQRWRLLSRPSASSFNQLKSTSQQGTSWVYTVCCWISPPACTHMACRVIRNDQVIHLTRLGTIGNVLATTVDLCVLELSCSTLGTRTAIHTSRLSFVNRRKDRRCQISVASAVVQIGNGLKNMDQPFFMQYEKKVDEIRMISNLTL